MNWWVIRFFRRLSGDELNIIGNNSAPIRIQAITDTGKYRTQIGYIVRGEEANIIALKIILGKVDIIALPSTLHYQLDHYIYLYRHELLQNRSIRDLQEVQFSISGYLRAFPIPDKT